jgi:hypothetical protein
VRKENGERVGEHKHRTTFGGEILGGSLYWRSRGARAMVPHFNKFSSRRQTMQLVKAARLLRIIERMSKDGQVWIDFAEFVVPDGSAILMDEEYHRQKFILIMQGYRFWRTETISAS